MVERFFAYAVIFAVGACLRLYAIGDQIVADDEMHSLRELNQHTALYIFSHFFSADISTPLTLLQMLIGRIVGLSEVTARLPSILAGIGSLVALPLLARRHFNDRIALLFAALVSISPQLVYYSRYGRPYIVSALFVFCAVSSFIRWWEDARVRDGVAYVGCAAIATWFSVLSLPASLMPLAWGMAMIAVEKGAKPRDRRATHLGVIGAALMLTLAVLLAAPIYLSLDAITSKAGAGTPDLMMLRWSASLLAGTRMIPVLALFWIAVLVGAAITLSKPSSPASLVALVPVAQSVAVFVAAPSLVQVPAVYARYVACALPFILLLVALAVARIRNSGLWAATASLVVLGLAAAGPLSRVYAAPNNFTNHADYQYTYELPEPLERISSFYCMLGEDDLLPENWST